MSAGRAHLVLATILIVASASCRHHHHQQQQDSPDNDSSGNGHRRGTLANRHQYQHHRPVSGANLTYPPGPLGSSGPVPDGGLKNTLSSPEPQQQGMSFRGPLQSRMAHLRHQHLAHNHHHHQHQHFRRGPYFEDDEGFEIYEAQQLVAHLGDTAVLDCRVAMLAGKMVMWLRESPDKALLTMGRETHIADERYSVQFKYPNNWRLAISPVRKDDQGIYVCQVNTHPTRMLMTNVTILAPEIRIVDEANREIRDRYYQTGSIIDLRCIVRPSGPAGSRVPHPVWKKKNAENHLDRHVGVFHSNGTNNELMTRLRIERASKSDRGEFSCSIGHLSTSTVNIHVLNGENQAAVHHDQWNQSGGGIGPSSRTSPLLYCALIVILV